MEEGTSDPKTIMIVAGEPSGDLHGSNLIKEIKRITPATEVFGIGGSKMENAGVELIYRIENFAIIGLAELLGRLPFFWQALSRARRLLEQRRPDLLILINYPGFNLRLAKSAKKIGVPVMYYISPQVWAWWPSRASKIAKLVSKMVVILPFEVPLFKKYGVDVEFVGHPLLDIVQPKLSKSNFCKQWDISPESTLIGLLPGSREQEVERLLPIMIESVEAIKEQLPALEAIVGSAEIGDSSLYERLSGRAKFKVRVIKGETYDIMKHSDLLLIASGTATLEAAIIGTPMIILYKMAFLSYLIGRMVVRVPDIGLVNILAGKRIVPEFVQKDARPERIASTALKILRRGDQTRALLNESYLTGRAIRQGLADVRGRLGQSGASRGAAEIALEMLASKPLYGDLKTSATNTPENCTPRQNSFL